MPSGQEKSIFSPGFVLNFLNVVVFVVKVVVVIGGVVVLGVEVRTDAISNNNCSYDFLLQKNDFQDYLE